MRTVSIRLCDMERTCIPIGFVGENLYTRVRIDSKVVFDEYPTAIASLTVQDPNGTMYPGFISRDGDVIIWDVSASDLVYGGNGALQLAFFVDDVIAKSYICRTYVSKAMIGPGTIPTPIASWIDAANVVLGEAEEVFEALDNMTVAAETLAAGSTATAEISDVDGHKHIDFGIPQGDQGERGETGPAGRDGTDGADGFSPTLVVTTITGGHRITITDKNGSQTVDVLDGEKGDTGATGNGIASVVLNQDYTLTINYTNGQSMTTTSIRGEKGETGATGQTGATGATPIISIGTVTTGAPGSEASATMDTTDPAHPVLSMSIPEGEPGDATIDDTSTAADRVWSAQKTNGLLSAISSVDEKIESITIQGYKKNTESITGTMVNNAFWDNSNKSVSINGWSYLTVEAEAGETYLISGTASTGARLFYAVDISNNLIYTYGSEQTVWHEDYEFTAPSGTVGIIVNAQNSQGSPSVKHETLDFVATGNTPIGTNTSGTEWIINGGKFANVVDLNGSANGTFTYKQIKYDGNTFKTTDDDISPLNLLNGIEYIGANHGYIFAYDVTVTGHGLTISDIGKTYTENGNTWVLLKIISENVFEVICRNMSAWYDMKRVNPFPETLNFGVSLSVESSALSQILPSVKNVTINVVKNTNDVFEVAESYDIIDPSAGIAWLISNVGSADNDSLVAHSDSAITVRNLYRFGNNGECVITHSIKALKSVGLNFYSGSQSSKFGSSDYYCVPQVSNTGSLNAANETDYFDKNEWDDQTIPPAVYLQANNNVSNMSQMMLTGVEMEGRTDSIDSTAGFVYGSSSKMYPYAIQPNKTLSVGDVYSFITYRIPMKVYDKNSTMQFVGWVKINGAYYVFCYAVIAVKASIELPKEMYGLKAETIMSKYGTLKSEYVATTLEVETSRQGCILVKLY